VAATCVSRAVCVARGRVAVGMESSLSHATAPASAMLTVARVRSSEAASTVDHRRSRRVTRNPSRQRNANPSMRDMIPQYAPSAQELSGSRNAPGTSSRSGDSGWTSWTRLATREPIVLRIEPDDTQYRELRQLLVKPWRPSSLRPALPQELFAAEDRHVHSCGRPPPDQLPSVSRSSSRNAQE